MQISDFIALTALATSLFSIWLQNRGVRKQLLVTNISEYTKRYQEIFEKLPKSVIDENFDINTFSEDEREKIRWKMGEGREMEREEKKNSMVEVEREDVRTYHQVEDSSV